jgi:ABC-type cobalamin/Fe3+-siderophores transport system ATPase subunit
MAVGENKKSEATNLEPRAPSPAARLAVEGVTFRYPHFEMGPISFEAVTGQVFAIIGPNGSGKSTLLEIASGHVRPAAGTALLNGEDLHRLSPRERAKRVGVARQDAPLLFSFDVREFIRQGRHAHLSGGLFESDEDERWVDWASENTNLRDLALRRVTEISGGEFQRAVLARALVQRPQLLLLDEPTANLDIRYQIEMLRLVRRLAASEGFVAVVVTHELNLAAELADRLMLIEAGRSVCQGAPSEVLRSDLVSRVFGTSVEIDKNPTSGRPRVTWIAP